MAANEPSDIERAPENKPEVAGASPSHSILVEASFSGPLPNPATLQAYDMVLPGLAERIVNRWETQSDHRMALEKSVIEGDNRRANWGLVSATVISLAVLGVSGVLAMGGHETVAGVLAGADIAALAGVFVYGTNTRKQERVEKTKTMTGREERR